MMTVRAADLQVGDRYHWYSWRTVTGISRTDRDRFADGKGNGVWITNGGGMPDRLWEHQAITVAGGDQ